jgi:hypothetical protein
MPCAQVAFGAVHTSPQVSWTSFTQADVQLEHVTPHDVVTSAAQAAVQAVEQQVGFVAQIAVTHGSQPLARFVPTVQISWLHVAEAQHVALAGFAQTCATQVSHEALSGAPGAHLSWLHVPPVAGSPQYSLNWQSPAVKQGFFWPLLSSPPGSEPMLPVFHPGLPVPVMLMPPSGTSG